MDREEKRHLRHQFDAVLTAAAGAGESWVRPDDAATTVRRRRRVGPPGRRPMLRRRRP
jgi:hypothetical protein